MPFIMKLGLDGNIFISLLDFFPDFKIAILPVLVNWLIIQYPRVRMYVCIVQKSH